MNVEDMFKKDAGETTLTQETTPADKSGKVDGEGKALASEGDDKALTDKVAPSTNKRFKKILDELEEKDQKLSELESFKQDVESGKYNKADTESIPSEWLELFGDNSQKAWEINKGLLNKMATQTKEDILRDIESRQQAQVQEQKKWERFIDTNLEMIEDERGIDLTSNAPAARKARQELLEIVSDLSPKDETGNIVSYIPFDKAYEYYELKNVKKPDTSTSQKKEIATRSMARTESGSSIEENEIGTGNWRTKYFPDN